MFGESTRRLLPFEHVAQLIGQLRKGDEVPVTVGEDAGTAVVDEEEIF